MKKLPRQIVTWISMLMLCGFAMVHTNCSEFGQGLKDFTDFCKAVGDKCSQQTAADCAQKLGGDGTKLKSPPDYNGAKNCTNALTTCDTLPNSCWFFAVESFNNPTETTNSETTNSETTADGGGG